MSMNPHKLVDTRQKQCGVGDKLFNPTVDTLLIALKKSEVERYYSTYGTACSAGNGKIIGKLSAGDTNNPIK